MIKSVLLGWDFWGAVVVTAIVWIALPEWVGNGHAKELYEMGVSVLSIVFAVFFTALAVIVAAGDDEFVMFLKDVNLYGRLVGTFKFTLWSLFGALFYAVAVFAFSVGSTAAGYSKQHKVFLVVYVLLFCYSLFATISSTGDTLSYAKYRLEFLERRKKGGEK